MYKLLLSWRYLRTRFIALASVVSVTLGVATLIVVNSVMNGFIDEMHSRLHGILSDIEISATGMDVIQRPDWHMAKASELLGDRIEAIATVVHVPALLSFEFNGRPMTQQVALVGIDDQTYGKVTDFYPYLMNEKNRQRLTFALREDGYDQSLGECGWPYRREKFQFLQELERQQQQQFPQAAQPKPETYQTRRGELPDEVPQVPALVESSDQAMFQEHGTLPASAPPSAADPLAGLRPQLAPEDRFNPVRDQKTGIVLGIAISNRKLTDPKTGEVKDLFLIRPGDDVNITLPTAGANARAVMENCTVVDFYSSKMHEYDNSFAFMPLSKLQSLRGMIDPVTGYASSSSIRIKLKPGVDLNEAKASLLTFFSPDVCPYVIQTWQDTQRPLLSAVNLELTILNILLFLIIAVAGFGILATFFMIVVEKTKDIGILKSLGAPNRGVMSIFLGYGFSLGSVGTGVGILLGLVLVWNINRIADWIGKLSGREVFDPTIYYFSEIPTIVSPWMVLWVAFGAISIAVLASVLPALRAARLHPVRALRYE